MVLIDMLTGLAGPLLLRWSLGLAHSSLLVAGALECPAPEAVEARVREILGLRADEPIEEQASLVREGSALRVVVRGADARLLVERVLPAQGNCDEQASAVAVVLAAWLSDVHPEYVGALPAAPAAPAAAVLATPSPAETPRGAPSPAATPSEPARPPPPVRDSASATAGSPPNAARRQLELSAAAGAALSSATPAPFATLGARYLPAAAGFGVALSATFTTPRRALLSSGAVSYFRWPLVVGPALRARWGAARLDVSAGPAAAWLHLGGVGFQGGTASHEAITFGGAASARLALPQGTVAPFVELSGMAFAPSEAFVRRGTDEPSVSLPNLELYAALGGSFGSW